MSQGTSEVALRQALVTALRARAALADVQVLYAIDTFETGDDHLQDEAIWFGDTEWVSSVIPVLNAGTKKVDETYEIEFSIQVVKTDGSSQETADVRAVVLLAELQQAFAETPQVSSNTMWGEMHMLKHIVGPVSPGPGHVALFEGVIWAKARLA